MMEQDNTVKNFLEFEDFIFLPDDFFVFNSIEISGKISEKSLSEFIHSQIVENSPFPIESLSWGFVTMDTSRSKFLWFAGIKDRIVGALGETEHAKHVLPFAALGVLCCADNFKKCKFFYEKYVSVFENQQPISYSNSSSHLQTQIIEQERVLQLLDIKRTEKAEFKCRYLEKISEDEAPKEMEIVLQSKQIWDADIRDKHLLNTLKKQQQLTYLVKRGMQWVTYALLFIMAWQGLIFCGNIGLKFKQNTCRRLSPAAKKVENKDFLVRQMQSVVEQEMRPFELLGLLNIHRPSNIYFLTATIDNRHNIVIDAMSETAMAVDDYVQALKESGCFDSVVVNNIQVSQQGTKFKLSCDFKEKKGDFFTTLKNTL